MADATREARLEAIRREVAHARATRWPEGDSWIRGYAVDCDWLLAELDAAEREREEWFAAHQRLAQDHYFARMEAAEARVAVLEEEALVTPERYVHPLTPEEHAEVVLAVTVMIDVLPIGDDERGRARARLVSALEKLEAHAGGGDAVKARSAIRSAIEKASRG